MQFDQRFAGTFGARIILADDNADMRTYVRDLLAHSYIVETVVDGEQALAAIRRNRPDLILADMMMPRLDGFGLLKALRADAGLRAIPVIFVSARAGEDSRIEGLDAGADDYLMKPFSGRELLTRVGALLERDRLHRDSLEQAQSLSWVAEAVSTRLNLALASITDQFFVLDHEWRYMVVNPRVLEMTGKSQAELIDRSIFEVFPDLRGTDFDRELHAASDDRSPRRFEYWYGAYERWFEVTAYPSAEGLALLISDITQRKHLQALAAARTAQFETLLNEAPIGVYLVDADFCIRQVNPTAHAVFGDIPDLIGRNFDALMHILSPESYADEIARLFRHTLETGEPYSTSERIQERKDNRNAHYYEWQISRIPLPDNRYGVVCYFRDISAQVRVRMALEQADRQKDQFLTMLAHELRNPLVPIANAAEMLTQTMPADSKAQAAGVTIKRQVMQLTRLVDDLLDVSRITRGRIDLKRTAVDLSQVISHAVEAVESLVSQKQQELSIRPSFHPLLVDADFTRLVQCVENLLINAAKYTDAGGTIRVQTRAEQATAIIEISDTGIGISPDLLPHIFDPFVQSDRTPDRSQGGLGIGLSVVKGFIEMHGGLVDARSAGLGHGSTFEIRLPLLDYSNDTTTEIEELKVSPRRILVVDDHAKVADSLAALLTLVGHTTEIAYTSAQALERVASFNPEVVLLDLGLPEMDGHELAGRLRQTPQCATARLIALTGYGTAEDRQRSREAGFDDHLVKPADLDTLQRAIAGTRTP